MLPPYIFSKIFVLHEKDCPFYSPYPLIPGEDVWTFQWHTIFANCPTVTYKYDFIKHLISQKKNRYDPIDSLLELNELYLTFSIFTTVFMYMHISIYNISI